MADSDESVELLFFDTFSHDITEVIINQIHCEHQMPSQNCENRVFATKRFQLELVGKLLVLFGHHFSYHNLKLCHSFVFVVGEIGIVDTPLETRCKPKSTCQSIIK